MDLLPVTLADEIACIERELKYRRAVYPRQIEKGRMSADFADRQITVMEAVLTRLKIIQRNIQIATGIALAGVPSSP